MESMSYDWKFKDIANFRWLPIVVVGDSETEPRFPVRQPRSDSNVQRSTVYSDGALWMGQMSNALRG